MQDKNYNPFTQDSMKNLPSEDVFSKCGVSTTPFIYRLLGAFPLSESHWVLKTSLTVEELPSLWMAIGIELLHAENIRGLQEFPAVRTDFGLRIGKDCFLDLIAKDENWYEVEKIINLPPTPAVIIAGLPGSGKSTIAEELRQIVTVPNGLTLTTRSLRSKDIDFECGRFVELNVSKSLELRRSPIYAVPVAFRGKEYFFDAASLIERFNPANQLTISIDSHYFRVIWKKRLMPDIKIVWLEASNFVLESRLKKRLTQETISESYLEACRKTKSIADFLIKTDALDEKQSAKKLLLWLDLCKL